jgi:hypothetical protein
LTTIGTPHGSGLAWIGTVIAEDPDDCRFYPFSRDSSGYGRIWQDARPVGAHRYVCQIVHGPPSGARKYTLHSCGNGHLGCVTPKHLRWGTKAEDAVDRRQHGREVLWGRRLPRKVVR